MFGALVVALASCGSPGAVSLKMVAPDRVSSHSGSQMVLPVTAQLRNDRKESIKLMAGTPCAVFSWQVLSMDGEPVEAEPNRLCAQVVASQTLKSGEQTGSRYEILLTRNLYSSGRSYRLAYKFWGYPGEHIFIVK